MLSNRGNNQADGQPDNRVANGVKIMENQPPFSTIFIPFAPPDHSDQVHLENRCTLGEYSIGFAEQTDFSLITFFD